mmetsp:Transcript_96/g.232  ORF Transcript_96/g.232 Transcript_96/m.232 type:complete len:84 (+) Transcript_96:112-363(+)
MQLDSLETYICSQSIPNNICNGWNPNLKYKNNQFTFIPTKRSNSVPVRVESMLPHATEYIGQRACSALQATLCRRLTLSKLMI